MQLKVDEDIFLTGCEDGFVRAYHLRPNKLLRVVGQHQEDEHFSVQSLALSRCKNILASTSHDNSIKFYDISQISRRINSANLQEQENGVMKQEMRVQNEDDDFQDMSDSSQQQSEQMQSESQKKKPQKKRKKMSMKQRETELKKNNQKKFFQGL